MSTSFEDMEKAAPEPLWVVFDEDGYVLENDEEGLVEERDGPLVGQLTRVQEDVGENGSRLYTVRLEDVDRPVKFWGKAHVDSQVDDAGIEPGDDIGILRTGNEVDTGQESPMQEFDVRFAKNGAE